MEAHLVFPLSGHEADLAHYAEHLAWLSALGQETRQQNRHSNAWTSERAVGYWLSSPAEDLPEILATLAGVFDPIDLPREFAEQERNIVLREYEMRVASNLNRQVGEDMNAFLYQGNTIAASVIGTPADIMAFDYDEAHALHAATHRPESATLLVIGDVTERQVRRALRQVDWPIVETTLGSTGPPHFELLDIGERQFSFPDADAAARLIWRKVIELDAPIQFDLLEAQSALLRNILDSTLQGGLAGPLRFENSITSRFAIEIWPIDERHVEISFTASPDRDISLTTLHRAFVEALTLVAADGVPEETYTRIRSRFDDFWPDWEDEEETSEWMAGYALNRISSLRTPLSEQELQQLSDQLSHETTNTLLRQLLGPGRVGFSFIGPEAAFE